MYDWSDVKDDKLMRYMMRLTEPGDTKMWDGWFTTYLHRRPPKRTTTQPEEVYDHIEARERAQKE